MLSALLSAILITLNSTLGLYSSFNDFSNVPAASAITLLTTGNTRSFTSVMGLNGNILQMKYSTGSNLVTFGEANATFPF